MYSRLTEKLYMSPLRLYCIGNFILKDFQIVHRVGLSMPDTRSEPYKPTGFATNEKRVALQSHFVFRSDAAKRITVCCIVFCFTGNWYNEKGKDGIYTDRYSQVKGSVEETISVT